ncbi:hypothetical protein EPHNCH_1164 [Anaplasma phagocytophilum str. NCH-1]|uniref:Uncharacterized protein n=1 Tax=Anaplasma phagocytophilum str. NCH-1 TaxID=1359161 RepID=A0A0F3N7X1_ANAPH|nr:hypothetical protein EPHNCH_1164 [Anaplasma phagocytophilum str. NCH-1]
MKQFYQMKRAVYGAVNKIYNKLIYKTHAVSRYKTTYMCRVLGNGEEQRKRN